MKLVFTYDTRGKTAKICSLCSSATPNNIVLKMKEDYSLRPGDTRYQLHLWFIRNWIHINKLLVITIYMMIYSVFTFDSKTGFVC